MPLRQRRRKIVPQAEGCRPAWLQHLRFGAEVTLSNTRHVCP
jgi:hypothetical protein